jgi:hypothetical protein
VLFVMASVDDAPVAEQILQLARYLHLPSSRVTPGILSCRGSASSDVSALRNAGVAVDLAGHFLDFEGTVRHVARSVSRHDIIVGCQDVADLYPALDSLALIPPLIEWGRTVHEAASGPKHHTRLYIAETAPAWRCAVHRMPGPQDVFFIPPLVFNAGNGDAVASLWQAAFDRVSCGIVPAPVPSVFRTFWQGGFECSSHRRHDGRRLDVVADSGHDVWVTNDYDQLGRHGMKTVRDGVRWHLIEPSPGRFDFSSLTPMLMASDRMGTQVIWDLLHYGWPDDLDIWNPRFVARFAGFATAVARHVGDVTAAVPFWCPVNEISFMAWGGGDVGYLNPFARGRGFELKVQLARAAIAAMEALLEIDPRARFVHCEPAIAVHYDLFGSLSQQSAEDLNESQFQAFDLISGRLWPQIGGRQELLDICGLNYYHNNQWLHGGGHLYIGDAGYRPLADILHYVHARYGRPVAITETGIEGAGRAEWLTYVATEALRARARGVPVEGLCLYPVADHAGWDDDRHCPNGLLGRTVVNGQREVYGPLATALAELQNGNPELCGNSGLGDDSGIARKVPAR